MLKIFIGMDARQPISYNVLAYSIAHNSSVPVSITPLSIKTLPVSRTGLTEFTYTRYLVPYLCGYEGVALFLDADMVVDGDIAELFKQVNMDCGVTVCGTKEPFEWPSAMLFNCALCKRLTPELIQSNTPQRLDLWSDGGIGFFGHEWNWCVGYDHDDTIPKLVHYTAGIPCWEETKNSRYAEVWNKYHRMMNSSVSYDDLMRISVHHKKVVSGEINR